jgi:hypothetical protein
MRGKRMRMRYSVTDFGHFARRTASSVSEFVDEM